MKSLVAFTLLFFTSLSVFAQTARFIRPSATDPAIDTVDNFHVVYPPESTANNKLLIFLPGSGGQPVGYREFMAEASRLGYHVLGLQYVNTIPVNSICNASMDPDCAEDVRSEIIYGDDFSDLVNVTKANGVINRSHKLLENLILDFPGENWEQYLVNDSIDYAVTTWAGHSQGGGHSAFFGTRQNIERVIMMGSVDFLLAQGMFASWQNPNGATPTGQYYGFAHEDDEIAGYNAQRAGWEALGMTDADDPLSIDGLDSIPENARCFRSTATPNTDPGAFHNATTVDNNVPIDGNGDLLYTTIWQHMLMVTDTTTPPPPMEPDTLDCISQTIPANLASNICTNISTISWGEVVNADRYIFNLFEVDGGVFTSLVSNETVSGGTQFDLNFDLLPNTEYAFSIVALNDSAQSFNCDSLFYFTTNTVSAPLIGVVNAPQSVCANDSSELQVIVDRGQEPFVVTWQDPMNTLNRTDSTTVTFSSTLSGTFPLNVSLTDSLGCSSNIDSLEIEVLDEAVAGIFIADTLGCASSPLDIQWEGFVGAESIEISDDGINFVAVDSLVQDGSIYSLFLAEGDYFVRGILNKDLPCSDSTESVAISIIDAIDKPLIERLGDDSICLGDSTSFRITNYNDGIIWNNDSSIFGSNIVVKDSGAYFATVTDPNSGCIANSDTLLVFLRDSPLPGNLFAPVAQVCFGDTIELIWTNFEGSDALEFSPDDISYFPLTGVNVSDSSYRFVLAPNTYFFRGRASAFCGSEVTNSVSVTVDKKLNEPIISFIGEPVICDGDSTSILIENYNNGIIWNSDSTLNSNPLVVDTPGEYSASITNALGCFIQSDTVTVEENARIDAPILSCTPDSILSDGIGARYAWFKNGNLIRDAEDFGIPYIREPGEYQALAFSDAGCLSDTSETLVMPKVGEVLFEGVILTSSLTASRYQWYFNGEAIEDETTRFLFHESVDGSYTVELFNDQDCISAMSEPYILNTTGLNEKPEIEVNVYPNPSQGSVMLDWSQGTEILNVQLISGNGAVIANNRIEPGKRFQITDLAKGLYILSAQTSQGQSKQRIIVL